MLEERTIVVTAWYDESKNSAGAQIRAEEDEEIPLWAMVVSTEHMMKATSLMSGAGLEKTLELLTEGAIGASGVFKK